MIRQEHNKILMPALSKAGLGNKEHLAPAACILKTLTRATPVMSW